MADTNERHERTALGYRRFQCHTCQREFNERTGTRFNQLQYPTDVVCLVVLWRVRYKLRLRDLPEMFLGRGVVFTHEAVREWEAQLAPPLSETLRKHRRGRIGCGRYVDETFIKVKGRLAYLPVIKYSHAGTTANALRAQLCMFWALSNCGRLAVRPLHPPLPLRIRILPPPATFASRHET